LTKAEAIQLDKFGHAAPVPTNAIGTCLSLQSSSTTRFHSSYNQHTAYLDLPVSKVKMGVSMRPDDAAEQHNVNVGGYPSPHAALADDEIVGDVVDRRAPSGFASSGGASEAYHPAPQFMSANYEE
jgi:hypothetical protein